MQGLTTGTTPRAASKAVILMAVGTILLLATHLCYSYPSLANWKIPATLSKGTPQAVPDNVTLSSEEVPQETEQEEDLPCQHLEGGEDVVVVMRTGATEIKDKLPAHLNTTFKCYNDYIILSDYEEEFAGHQVHDLLSSVDDSVKSSHPDFELYRRLQAHGRAALDDSELSGAVSAESGPIGKLDNEGWRLDKWKFLPMAVRTLELRPDAKWYVFVEPDTYLMWSNLLDWLRTLDPSEPLYYGSEVQIESDVFAHGGSAFLLSRPALQRAAALYTTHAPAWHALTSAHWAGDCLLGKALLESGVPLTWSWPMFQGGNPHTMDFAETKPGAAGADHSLWCAPALSYHHLAPAEIASLFAFEQAWLRQAQSSRSAAGPSLSWRRAARLRIHHQDVFRSYLLPQTAAGPRSDWSNGSGDLVKGTENITLTECRELCEGRAACVQFAVSEEGCWFAREGRVGREMEGWEAGWLPGRVGGWADGKGVCGVGVGGWTVS